MEPTRIQGRLIGAEDIAWIKQLIAEQPQWNRTRISQHICQTWNWRNEAGRIKDMAARSLLLKLQVRGLIQLPRPQGANGNTRRKAQPPSNLQGQLSFSAPPSVEGELKPLLPIGLERVDSLRLRREASRLLALHHYLGFSGPVGENIQYIARDVRGRELAVMVFERRMGLSLASAL